MLEPERRQPSDEHPRLARAQDAETALREIATQLDDGVYLAPENISFESWADRWLDSLPGELQ